MHTNWVKWFDHWLNWKHWLWIWLRQHLILKPQHNRKTKSSNVKKRSLWWGQKPSCPNIHHQIYTGGSVTPVFVSSMFCHGCANRTRLMQQWSSSSRWRSSTNSSQVKSTNLQLPQLRKPPPLLRTALPLRPQICTRRLLLRENWSGN